MADGRHFKQMFSKNVAYQLTDLDEIRVLASHHVPDMSAMMWLPWQPPLPSNGALNVGVWRPNA